MSHSVKKQRLDLLLSEARPELSRSRIQAEIMAGKVRVNGIICDKPGTIVASDAAIELLEPKNPYVSRGGLKIAAALENLDIDVDGSVVLDVGASTGGFTDCLLNKNARLIYALDVGYGQLASKLRNDPRIVVMERFNIRNLKNSDLPITPDLAVIDVSFISLSKVFPVLSNCRINQVLALVKPQFEAGRLEADKGSGVIRDPALHSRVLSKTINNAREAKFCCRGITYSKFPGPKGNIEYFIYLVFCGEHDNEHDYDCSLNIERTVLKNVQEAHRRLSRKKI